MTVDYSPDICRKLEGEVAAAGLLRVYRPTRYDPGRILEAEVTGVCPARRARARMVVERFVGGGFAGQVYRVRLDRLDLVDGPVQGLEVGRSYALKILTPPSRFARLFRNAIYAVAYQGAFSAQVNYAAARVGVLWQKLVRRGARIRFGDEKTVVDTHATFFDSAMGVFAEINEWVDGRVWRFEIDDRVFARRKCAVHLDNANSITGSSREYLGKRRFMARLVDLLREMGAPELARQYEWWTMKSQPNVLKRKDSTGDSQDGLVAIDFRAGLALLPFLPMSPGDFRLILRGLGRGDLVQFDRGNLSQLERFIARHGEEFRDLVPALDELRELEPRYRDSLVDVTHHHVRLLTRRTLRGSIAGGFIQGWLCRGIVDKEHASKLTRSSFAFILFFLLGAVPVLGRFARRLWGNATFANHLRHLLASRRYFVRSARARQAERLIDWYRRGRANDRRALSLLDRPFAFWTQRVLLGWLPAKWHRFLTDWTFARDSIKYAVTYPVRFYRDAAFRVEWLTNEVEGGADEGMLEPEEKEHILNRVSDPFIQKYLKCVAVHICTLPVTQVVSVVLAVWGYFYLGNTWQESMAWALGILALFQATPISPGSLVRGTYVVYLMIRERNIRNYWIAVLVSYWHYIGYLGFPLQMVKEFPSLARFMGGRWATRMVRLVPVFGERGALLEHWVFDLFFNVPVSLRRKLSRRRPVL